MNGDGAGPYEVGDTRVPGAAASPARGAPGPVSNDQPDRDGNGHG
jgi:hypothetical protein